MTASSGFGSGRCGSCHGRLGGGCHGRLGCGRRCGRFNGCPGSGGFGSGRGDAPSGSSGQANSKVIARDGSPGRRTRRCAGSRGLDRWHRHRPGSDRLDSRDGRDPGGGRQYDRL